MTSYIKTEIKNDGVAIVTLSRPEKHNAFDDHIIDTLKSAFVDIDQNPDVKVMILAAEGESFSAGADLSWMKRMASFSYEENLSDAYSLATMLRTLDQLSKPTIARVQGAAFGGAVGLVSCCDIAVGTPAAKFCLSEVNVGLVPATISPYVVRAIGSRAARRYCITGETIDAENAQHLGLLSSVVQPDDLDLKVSQFSEIFLSNGERAMATTKKLISAVSGQSISEELVNYTSSVIAKARVSEEAQERLQRFLNSRNAVTKTSEKE